MGQRHAEIRGGSMTFRTKFGVEMPARYSACDFKFASVARRVCDRRIHQSLGNGHESRPWGTRIVLVSVPYISLIDRRAP